MYQTRNDSRISVNLDKFTLIKLWGKMAQEIFSSQAKPFEENGYIFWKLEPNIHRFPELSSMNFILKNNGQFRDCRTRFCKFFRHHFTFGFWDFSKSGFTNSSVIINNDDSVHTVLKSSKSIYIPSRPTYVKIDIGREKDVEVKVVPLLELIYTSKGYRLVKLENVIFTKGIAERFENEQKCGQVFINGVVADFIRRSTRYKLLAAIDLYEIANFELCTSLIGIVSTNKFYKGDSFSYVGNIEDIKKETMDVMILLFSFSHLDQTIGDCFDLFTTALNYIKPILALDNEQVFFMHPSVIIALIENRLERILDNNKDRAITLRFLDLLSERSENIYNSEEACYLKIEDILQKL